MDGTFEFQNAMHGRWKDTGYRNANGLLSAVHWNFPALTCVRSARAVRKLVHQLEDSGLLNLRRSVKIFSFCSWLFMHQYMATCTRMTRTNRLRHVSIPFHMVAWKSMQFTSRPCGPSKKVCQQPCSRTNCLFQPDPCCLTCSFCFSPVFSS